MQHCVLESKYQKTACHTLPIGPEHYAEKILTRFRMADCKFAPTPTSQQLNESVFQADTFDSPIYRHEIGNLSYLMICTKPDVTFAARRLMRVLKKPSAGL